MDQNSPEESPFKNVSGLRRIWNAAGYSVSGLRAAFIHEAAFRQEVALAVVLFALAAALPATLTQTAILILAVVIVLITELINSAIEAAVDHTSTKRHELAKRAKDVGSAAVLVALVNCGVIWALVLVDLFA